MSTHQAVRRWIITGAVTATTVVGTIYGASLKGDQELKQERKRMLEATPEEMIAQLEFARQDLARKKTEIERKMEAFAKRKEGKEPGQQQSR